MLPLCGIGYFPSFTGLNYCTKQPAYLPKFLRIHHIVGLAFAVANDIRQPNPKDALFGIPIMGKNPIFIELLRGHAAARSSPGVLFNPNPPTLS
jgi:hypothetical protein